MGIRDLETYLSSEIRACALTVICPWLGQLFYGPVACDWDLLGTMTEYLHSKGIAVEGSLPLLTV